MRNKLTTLLPLGADVLLNVVRQVLFPNSISTTPKPAASTLINRPSLDLQRSTPTTAAATTTAATTAAIQAIRCASQ